MVEKYTGRMEGPGYSVSVQVSFSNLRGLVRTWAFKPEATKAERVQELLGQMRRLIGELGRAVAEK